MPLGVHLLRIRLLSILILRLRMLYCYNYVLLVVYYIMSMPDVVTHSDNYIRLTRW